MPRAIMMAFTEPTSPDREDEYNDWYDNVHLKDVLAIPGITSATRFKLSETQRSRKPDPSQPPYLAVYDIDANDIRSVLDDIGSRVNTSRMEICDAIALENATAVIYELMD